MNRIVTRDSAKRRQAPAPRPKAQLFDAFAVAAPGLEQIVAGELAGLNVREFEVVDGGVQFAATARALYEANLQLRTASRVLIRLAKFRAVSFAELERNAQTIHWERIIKRGDRVELRVTCRKSRLYHSGAVAQRIERDLVGRMGAVVGKAATGDDGESETSDAQLIVVRLDHDKCTVSADSSGAHLHRRGYRQAITQAPLRETLAAAMVIASGWDRTSPLLDPFCGSGTIPIEAAMIAGNIAPGKHRSFRFMHWPGHDGAEWNEVLSKATRRETLDALPSILGSDRSAAAIRVASENAVRAGVDSKVTFVKSDAIDIEPPDEGSGWIVSNPPYGVRLGEKTAAEATVRTFLDVFERFPEVHISLLTPRQSHRPRRGAMKPVFQTTNGGLAVVLLSR